MRVTLCNPWEWASKPIKRCKEEDQRKKSIMKQFRMVMWNLHMLCEIQKGRSCKEHLEKFLESIVYILYIISKLRKSGVQCFKRCANQSWNEEVMAIWRQLRQVEKEFRITFPWCEIFRTAFPWWEIFAPPSLMQKCNI